MTLASVLSNLVGWTNFICRSTASDSTVIRPIPFVVTSPNHAIMLDVVELARLQRSAISDAYNASPFSSAANADVTQDS